MLTVVPGDCLAVRPARTGFSSLIDQIVREGARQMLAAALQAEVAAYIAASSPGRGMRTAAAWWCATAPRSRGRC